MTCNRNNCKMLESGSVCEGFTDGCINKIQCEIKLSTYDMLNKTSALRMQDEALKAETEKEDK